MILNEFLNLISDEEIRIELEIDIEKDEDYSYTSFWLSDYRNGNSHALNYKNWKVQCISLDNIMDIRARLLIQVKE